MRTNDSNWNRVGTIYDLNDVVWRFYEQIIAHTLYKMCMCVLVDFVNAHDVTDFFLK
jgi:hypothetical protein